MPIDACTSTFAEMAAIILPGDMARLRAVSNAPLPMSSFCKQGFGVKSILSVIGSGLHRPKWRYFSPALTPEGDKRLNAAVLRGM